jgi:hypothetical protein
MSNVSPTLGLNIVLNVAIGKSAKNEKVREGGKRDYRVLNSKCNNAFLLQ